ncbi:unnamed protein product [Linum tenue]|uniref:Secreted protein n=1 Tax=Linum tenue TaxID=586396 RepID=A0AAV0P0P8_9ROSI|nr:unnamed protein product [Linum tenue]
MWLVNGVAAAFFASLDTCSCIRIATVDDAEDGNDAPLILNDGNVNRSPYAAAGGGSSRRRRTTKGKKQHAAVLYGGF